MFMLLCVPDPVCHTERKFVAMPAIENLARRTNDRIGLAGLEQAQVRIDLRRNELHARQRHQQGGGIVSLEIAKCSRERCVCAPQR